MAGERASISTLTHNWVRNKLLVEIASLLRAIKNGKPVNKQRESVKETHSLWTALETDLVPLICGFVVDCGPMTTLAFLFDNFETKDRNHLLIVAQKFWATRYDVENRVAEINSTIETIASAIQSNLIESQAMPDEDAVDEIYDWVLKLSHQLAELPAEKSV